MGNEEMREMAFLDYQNGMKYKDIAEKYGVSLSAIKSWAARHWKKEGCDRKEKKARPKGKETATKVKKQREAVAEDVKQVLENPDLTDKQRLFCLYYIRCFSATKAYRKAYECGYNTASAEGYKLLAKPCVRDEIQRLKQNRLNRELLDESDIFQKYMDIAFSDIKEQADIQGGMVRVRGDLDGTIVSEISETKDGIKIKLNDRMKALQWLSDHMGLATEEQQARIDVMRLKAQAGGNAPPVDDGFLDALVGTAKEDWDDETGSV